MKRLDKKLAFTLLEALLAAVVLSMVATAILMPFTAGAQSLAQDARSTLAINLAQDLMEEILAKSFKDRDNYVDDPQGRGSWDDLKDYNGYTEAAGQIKSFDGTLVTDPAATGLSRKATAVDYYVAGQNSNNPATFIKVTVEVMYKGATIVRINRLVYDNE